MFCWEQSYPDGKILKFGTDQLVYLNTEFLMCAKALGALSKTHLGIPQAHHMKAVGYSVYCSIFE